jgi:outer membrane protein assembly factor BamA
VKGLGLALIFFMLHLSQITAQEGGWLRQYFQKILNDSTQADKANFVAYPTLAYAPETQWEIGVSAIYVYYAGQDTLNRLSEITAFSFVTFEEQYGLWLDHALYSDKSLWFFLGRARFQQFPLLYYGIGPQTDAQEIARIDAGSIGIRERVLRKIKGSFYLGLELDLQRLSRVEVITKENAAMVSPPGAQPYLNWGLGLGLVFDNRHNVLNVREGFFGETGFLRYDTRLGSDFSFTQYFLDMRHFFTPRPQQTWATQWYTSHVEGNAPFNQLSLMGGESLMRGYYLGRYRDQTLMAAQTEYRFLPFPFSQRWGAAAFIGAGTVAHELRALDFNNLKWSGGAGLRFLIFPSKDIFTRLDVAFTEEGPGYYLFIGEAF